MDEVAANFRRQSALRSLAIISEEQPILRHHNSLTSPTHCRAAIGKPVYFLTHMVCDYDIIDLECVKSVSIQSWLGVSIRIIVGFQGFPGGTG